eukprot:Polyplicarium_translucidae@DN2742_c1_g1_i2.p1
MIGSQPPPRLELDCKECTDLGSCAVGTPSTNASPRSGKGQFWPIGVFDVFKVGLGPSSSHTSGPMEGCYQFIEALKEKGHELSEVRRAVVDLYGSLSLTGKGHSTDMAVLLGLSGFRPHYADPDKAAFIFQAVKNFKKLILGGDFEIGFDYDEDLIFNTSELPEHPNGMTVRAFDAEGEMLHGETYLSVGGGKVYTRAGWEMRGTKPPSVDVPYPFRTCSDLIRYCKTEGLPIAEIVMRNEVEAQGQTRKEVEKRIDEIYEAMDASVVRGLKKEGPMPVLGLQRQASRIHRVLKENTGGLSDHFAVMDWVSLFARAVNEENACGGRVVTAPTNGSCGTVAAVLKYFQTFHPLASRSTIRQFLCTAAAIGAIVKRNASVSGAEAGCQAEIGSACAMAAAGLTAVVGGTLEQVEKAAECALEYNLGMTCDPLAGVVVVPCIERNCIAAVQAIASSRLTMRDVDPDKSIVSFDSCVHTMYVTGKDMNVKYRETSSGGLAIHARRSSAADLDDATPVRRNSVSMFNVC